MCSGAGAVWVWDKSKAQVRTSQLHASSTYVVLTHGDGHADIQARPAPFHLPKTRPYWAFAGLHLLTDIAALYASRCQSEWLGRKDNQITSEQIRGGR